MNESTGTDYRGLYQKKQAAENQKKVKEFFEKNPEALMKDCMEALGFCAFTVRKHRNS